MFCDKKQQNLSSTCPVEKNKSLAYLTSVCAATESGIGNVSSTATASVATKSTHNPPKKVKPKRKSSQHWNVGLMIVMSLTLITVAILFYHVERTVVLLRREIDDLWLRQKESVQERHIPRLANVEDILQSKEETQHIVRRSINAKSNAVRNCKTIPEGYASFKVNKGCFAKCLQTKSLRECEAFGFQEGTDELNITMMNNALPWTFHQRCAMDNDFKVKSLFQICVQKTGTYLILIQMSVIHTSKVSVQLKVDNTAVRMCKGYGGNLLPRTVCSISHIAKIMSRSCISLHTLDVPLSVQYNSNDSLLQIIRLD